MTKAELLENLRHGVYTRLMPSPLGGVGVFAIRDIPTGINPFGEDGIKFIKFPVKEFREDPEIPEAVKKYTEDVCVVEGGYIYLPDCGINNINPGFLLNHSSSPNMKTDDEGNHFIALREIKAGEELTVDYYSYNDDVRM